MNPMMALLRRLLGHDGMNTEARQRADERDQRVREVVQRANQKASVLQRDLDRLARRERSHEPF